MIHHIVFDERARAAAPDFDAQPLTARAGHAVMANRQLGRVVAEDAATAGAVNRVVHDQVADAAPGQANAAAVLGTQADVLDATVTDLAVGHAAFHGRIATGEQDTVRAPGPALDQVADREVMEAETPGIGPGNSLLDQGILAAIQGQVGQLDVLAAVDTDEDRRPGAAVFQSGLFLPRAEQADLRFRPDRFVQGEGPSRQLHGVARRSTLKGRGDRAGIPTLGDDRRRCRHGTQRG